MKKIQLKGTAKNLPVVAPMLAMLVGMLVLLPLRISQLFNNTDMTTGFFLERGASVYVFYIVAVLTVLVVVALCFVCGQMPSHEVAQVRRPGLGAASVALAAAFGAQSINDLSAMVQQSKLAGLSVYEFCVGNGTVRNFFEAVLGCVTMVALTLLAIASVTGKTKWLRFPAVLFLAAPLWGTLRVIFYFTHTTSYLVLAELFCELYATIFLMLFLFSIARFFTETGSEGGTWVVFATGLLSALFCMLASGPRLISSIAGNGTVEGFGVNLIFAMGTLFSAFAVTSVLKHGVAAKEDAKESEPALVDENTEIPVEPFSAE
ncbi:MAG: hypothetical protein IKJ63_10780 [Clostridia bacterium]|nr:hypothetical protein [Clostridia bacterium]